FVMYWWHRAADLVRNGKAKRFGFITTNSIKQTFNRRVLEMHADADPPLSIVMAIPDHPWVESSTGASVRIAMTVASAEDRTGVLAEVVAENTADDLAIQVELEEAKGRIWPDLTIGVKTIDVVPLKANENLSFMGVKLVGDFVVTEEEAAQLGLGRVPGIEKHLPRFRNGSDITRRSRDVRVIDMFGL